MSRSSRFAGVAVAALCAVIVAPACARDTPKSPSALTLPNGFTIETIAHVNGARELAIAANGDLFIGTNGSTVDVVPDAQALSPGKPLIFVHLDDKPVAGVTIAGDTLYAGGQFGVYAIGFHAGDRSARSTPRKIATLRPSGVARDHVTTTVAVTQGVLYASVGSSCNNCQPDLDPTRATIQQMRLDGTQMSPKAEHIRNAIALTVNPQSGALWAGVAGQDELAHGHPYEIVDDISAHPGRVDFGWPDCYEDRKAVEAGHDCSQVALPRAVVPAYETPVGAAFYPVNAGGAHAFPAAYRGGLFLALHGSWHTPPVPPRVVFIPMNGDAPRTAVNWSDPSAQWREFVGGYQQSDGSRIGRPTGVAVGTDGSLFVADDDSGAIYRIRPNHT